MAFNCTLIVPRISALLAKVTAAGGSIQSIGKDGSIQLQITAPDSWAAADVLHATESALSGEGGCTWTKPTGS